MAGSTTRLAKVAPKRRPFRVTVALKDDTRAAAAARQLRHQKGLPASLHFFRGWIDPGVALDAPKWPLIVLSSTLEI